MSWMERYVSWSLNFLRCGHFCSLLAACLAVVGKERIENSKIS